METTVKIDENGNPVGYLRMHDYAKKHGYNYCYICDLRRIGEFIERN